MQIKTLNFQLNKIILKSEIKSQTVDKVLNLGKLKIYKKNYKKLYLRLKEARELYNMNYNIPISK